MFMHHLVMGASLSGANVVAVRCATFSDCLVFWPTVPLFPVPVYFNEIGKPHDHLKRLEEWEEAGSSTAGGGRQ